MYLGVLSYKTLEEIFVELSMKFFPTCSVRVAYITISVLEVRKLNNRDVLLKDRQMVSGRL
jgi:hypothetical protein